VKVGDFYRNDYWAIFEITEVTDQLVFVKIRYNSSTFRETAWYYRSNFERSNFEQGLIKLSSLELQLL
jgi:hypothetical protein